jgi:pyruvyl transferase EpsO
VAQRRLAWLECLAAQRARLLDTIKPLVSMEHPVALIGAPLHWNLGDSFLWLGSEQLVAALGTVPLLCLLTPWKPGPGAPCTWDNLRQHLGPSGTVLFQAGGNFGDDYLGPHRQRMDVLSKLPSNPAVVLPQSVHYTNASRAEQDAGVYTGHGSVVVLARTAGSLAALEKHFPKTPALLVPDIAFMLGPQLPNCQPDVDVFFLLRRDKERGGGAMGLQAALALLEHRGRSHVIAEWDEWRASSPSKAAMPWNNLTWAEAHAAALPQLRLQVANNMLCRGRVVVADRLHAMLLALLMGKPFVGYDNSLGKLSDYRSTHLDADTRCQPHHTLSFFRNNVGEAAGTAVELLDRGLA